MSKLSSLNFGGRAARLISGIFGLAAAAGLRMGIASAGLSRPWRLLLFPLLAAGFLGLVQAGAGT